MENENSSHVYAIAELVNDLSLDGLSNIGKSIIANVIKKMMPLHQSWIESQAKRIEDLESRCKSYEEKISQPQQREKEFEDVAKKLNFPDLKPISDQSVKNPNIELPFEDPVPKADIDFMKAHLSEKPKDKIILPKDERLTKKEIKAYTSEQEINKLAKEELKSLEKLDTFSTSSMVRQKRKTPKDKSKMSKKSKKSKNA